MECRSSNHPNRYDLMQLIWYRSFKTCVDGLFRVPLLYGELVTNFRKAKSEAHQSMYYKTAYAGKIDLWQI